MSMTPLDWELQEKYQQHLRDAGILPISLWGHEVGRGLKFVNNGMEIDGVKVGRRTPIGHRKQRAAHGLASDSFKERK